MCKELDAGAASGEPDTRANRRSGPRTEDESIAARQNSRWSMVLLAAQRQRYLEAKRWRSGRFWSVAVAAAVGLGATAFAPSLLVLVGPVGAVVGVAQWLAGFLERRHIQAGANIQEQFDTSVFALEWNLLGERVDAEDVAAAAGRFRGEPALLADWYAVPGVLSRPLDVLICQRSNLRWDSALRYAYSNAILLGLVTLAVATIGMGIVRNLSLEEFILALLPSAGAFIFGIDAVCSHRRHAAAQGELKRRVEAVWLDAVQGSRTAGDGQLRAIQDRIHHLRTAAPVVPEWFYWWRRDDYERQMRFAVERMAREAEETLRQRVPERPSRPSAGTL
ncbi:MAG: hypothetical protein LC118_11005 [Dehalococcoidia bacterium]|nr:hypothetical protein [Dehalococcoidia bacterium]